MSKLTTKMQLNMVTLLIVSFVSVARASNNLNLPDGIESILGFRPKSSFRCERDGYFGDVENECRIFHLCQRQPVGHNGASEWRHWTYACGNQTMFNQLTLTCAFVDEAIPCRHSHQFAYLNEVIHRPREPFLTDADVTSGFSYYANRIMSDGARARAYEDADLYAQIGGNYPQQSLSSPLPAKEPVSLDDLADNNQLTFESYQPGSTANSNSGGQFTLANAIRAAIQNSVINEANNNNINSNINDDININVNSNGNEPQTPNEPQYLQLASSNTNNEYEQNLQNHQHNNHNYNYNDQESQLHNRHQPEAIRQDQDQNQVQASDANKPTQQDANNADITTFAYTTSTSHQVRQPTSSSFSLGLGHSFASLPRQQQEQETLVTEPSKNLEVADGRHLTVDYNPQHQEQPPLPSVVPVTSKSTTKTSELTTTASSLSSDLALTNTSGASSNSTNTTSTPTTTTSTSGPTAQTTTPSPLQAQFPTTTLSSTVMSLASQTLATSAIASSTATATTTPTPPSRLAISGAKMHRIASKQPSNGNAKRYQTTAESNAPVEQPATHLGLLMTSHEKQEAASNGKHSIKAPKIGKFESTRLTKHNSVVKKQSSPANNQKMHKHQHQQTANPNQNPKSLVVVKQPQNRQVQQLRHEPSLGDEKALNDLSYHVDKPQQQQQQPQPTTTQSSTTILSTFNNQNKNNSNHFVMAKRRTR